MEDTIKAISTLNEMGEDNTQTKILQDLLGRLRPLPTMRDTDSRDTPLLTDNL